MDTLQAQGGHRAALLRWDPPADNGSIITGYRVERREGTGAWGNGVDLSATQTRHIARGLTNGVSYEFRARASSALGDGPWSDPAAATPDVMTPGRVRQVSASSGIESATVRWRGASDRGSAILRYRVQRRQAGSPTFGAPVIVDAAETSIEITGLAAGSSWEFRVRAENAVGDGAYSSPAAVTISSTVAEPGQVVGVAVAPGNATLTVTWPEPTDGGSPIVEYELQRKSSSTLLWPALAGVTVPGDQLVFTYAGLTNGTSYDVRVRALNAVGEGPWSLPATGSPAP
jgi:titin